MGKQNQLNVAFGRGFTYISIFLFLRVCFSHPSPPVHPQSTSWKPLASPTPRTTNKNTEFKYREFKIDSSRPETGKRQSVKSTVIFCSVFVSLFFFSFERFSYRRNPDPEAVEITAATVKAQRAPKALGILCSEQRIPFIGPIEQNETCTPIGGTFFVMTPPVAGLSSVSKTVSWRFSLNWWQ